MYKLINTVLSFVLVAQFFGAFNTAAAFVIDDTVCDLSYSDIADSAPDPIQIACPFVRLYNALILAVGVVLIAMIAIGGIRLSMSLGDPKGYQSASRTWTYTVWGVGIILGAFFIVRVLDYTLGLGLNFTNPLNIFDVLVCRIQDWLEFAWIMQETPVSCP